MITIQEARKIADTYAKQRPAAWFDENVIERATYWFFAVGFIGSCGVIVDEADGRLHVMGSGRSLEDYFWAHEHGFSPEFVSLRVTQVHDQRRTVEFLLLLVQDGPARTRNPNPKRAWLEKQLETLPCQFAPQRLALFAPAFRDAAEQSWFEYEVIESSINSVEHSE